MPELLIDYLYGKKRLRVTSNVFEHPGFEEASEFKLSCIDHKNFLDWLQHQSPLKNGCRSLLFFIISATEKSHACMVVDISWCLLLLLRDHSPVLELESKCFAQRSNAYKIISNGPP